MKEVTIYSTASCHYCQLAKEFFKSHNIAYTEHNVGVDAEKRKERTNDEHDQPKSEGRKKEKEAINKNMWRMSEYEHDRNGSHKRE